MNGVSKVTFWVTTIILILVAAGAAAGSWYYFGSRSDSDSTSDESADCPDDCSKLYRYELMDFGTAPNQDQMLIQINKETGERPVVVESIKDSVPEIGNNLLHLFADPQCSDLVFFQAYLPETDSPWSVLYSFDSDSKEFTKMAINETYTGTNGGFLKNIDETQFVFAPEGEAGDAQTMYLLDLLNDTSEELVSLADGEFFYAGASMLGSSYCYDLTWEDSDTIQYAVFNENPDETLDDCPEDVSTLSWFLEYRTIDI